MKISNTLFKARILSRKLVLWLEWENLVSHADRSKLHREKTVYALIFLNLSTVLVKKVSPIIGLRYSGAITMH